MHIILPKTAIVDKWQQWGLSTRPRRLHEKCIFETHSVLILVSLNLLLHMQFLDSFTMKRYDEEEDYLGESVNTN